MINFFNLTLQGSIRNLTLENHNNNSIELLYYNETLESNNTYEYHIYPPKCKNVKITSNNNRTSFIDLDSLFDRETNTNYYIAFYNIYSEDSDININENSFDYREKKKIPLDLSGNYMKYKIKNNINTTKNIDINYTISIDETYYSDICTISIIFCYFSCEECSFMEENPNEFSHYCIRCKENYLPFGNGLLNCYSEEEIKERNITYFYNENLQTKYECDLQCQRCIQLDKKQSFVRMKENLLIFENECLKQCLIETISIQNGDRLKACQECTSNCGIWEKEDTSWVINPSLSNIEIESTLFENNNTTSKLEISSSEIEKSTNKMDFTETDIEPETSNLILLTTINEQTTNDLEIKMSTSKLDYSTKKIEYSSSKIEVTTNDLEYSSSKINISSSGIKEEEYSTSFTNIKESSLLDIENSSSEIEYSTSKFEVTTNNIEDSSSNLDSFTSGIKEEEYSTTITDIKESSISNVENFTSGKEYSTSKIDESTNDIEYSKSNLDSSMPEKEEKTEFIKESSFNMESSLKEIDNLTTSKIQGFTSDIEFSSPNTEHIISKLEISTLEIEHSKSTIESSNSNRENSESEIQNSNTFTSKIYSNTSNIEGEPTLIETEFITLIKESTNDYQNFDLNEFLKNIENITLTEFEKQISKTILDFINSVNSSKLINGSDFLSLILSSDDMNTNAQIEKGISAIDLGNCTNIIKEYYNMTPNESFYVLNIESKRNKTENSEENKDKSYNLGKETLIELYDKSGNTLNLSICKDIKVMKFLDDKEKLKLELAESYSRRGIDVFNERDDFFNNICHDFSNTDGKDIIINDRRNDIYQNATFCQKGCSFSGIDYKLTAADCICNSRSLQINSYNNDTSNENKNKDEEIVNFKTLTKSIIEKLFEFNIDVIKCYNLVFNMKIFHNNIGFYCMSILIFLQIIFLFAFLIKRLKPLKLFMLIFSSYNPKENNFFPPPKSKKKMKKKKNSLVENNKYISKDISNNKKIKLNNVGKKINNKKSQIPHIKLKEENNKSNSIHRLLPKKERKIILANNFAQTINILSPIVNINNQKKINKKKLQKGILLGTSNNKNKLYTIKSNKKLFYKNMRNKNIKDYTKSKYLYNMKTIGDKNQSNIKFKNNRDLIILSKDNDNLQNLAYEQAILYDKRAYFRMYWAFLVDKQIILETFCKDNYLTLFVIKLSFLVCTFQISFF